MQVKKKYFLGHFMLTVHTGEVAQEIIILCTLVLLPYCILQVLTSFFLEVAGVDLCLGLAADVIPKSEASRVTCFEDPAIGVGFFFQGKGLCLKN